MCKYLYKILVACLCGLFWRSRNTKQYNTDAIDIIQYKYDFFGTIFHV